MENGPFEDVFPIENGYIHVYSIAMLVYQRVNNNDNHQPQRYF